MQLARQTPRLRAFRRYLAAFFADHEKFVARATPPFPLAKLLPNWQSKILFGRVSGLSI
jgi:hypothetical protein